MKINQKDKDHVRRFWKGKFQFILTPLVGFVIVCLFIFQINLAQAVDESVTQDPPCEVPMPFMFGSNGGTATPLYAQGLDNVLLYIKYPGAVDKEGYPLISGVLAPPPLRKEAIITTAVKIMKESGLMTCLKKAADEPLREPIIVKDRNDPRSTQPENLTAIIFADNREYKGEPYLLIWTNTFRPDKQFMTPERLASRTFAYAIFFVGKSDEEVQRELEIALSTVRLRP